MQLSNNNAVDILEYLAYGDINDTIRLLIELGKDKPSLSVIRKLDLRNVQSIRCTSTGGFEVGFYDRLKSLDVLCKYQQDNNINTLYDALTQAAGTCFSDRNAEDERPAEDEIDYISRHE